jgi:hypothetical protein
LSRCIAQVIRGIRTDIVARVLHRPIIAQASPKAFAGGHTMARQKDACYRSRAALSF